MDENLSADSSSKEGRFFRHGRIGPPARHISFTVKIRFIHNNSEGASQTAHEPAAIAPHTQTCPHHAPRCNPLAATANGMWQVIIQRFCTWSSRLLPPAPLVRHDHKGLAMTGQPAKALNKLRLRIQTIGLTTQHPPVGLLPASLLRSRKDGRPDKSPHLPSSPVIASCAAAWRSSIPASPATGLLHAAEMNSAPTQRGAVLITGLIFLVILMLIGTTAMQGTLLEEKMAGNLRDETLAFQAAEAALRSGERFLEQVTIPEFNSSDGLYFYADCWGSESGAGDEAGDTAGSTGNACAPENPATWPASDWSDAAKTRSVEIETDGVASQPRYFIEQLPNISLMGNSGSAQQSGSLQTASIFRIVARGVGGNDATAAILQSTYQR